MNIYRLIVALAAALSLTPTAVFAEVIASHVRPGNWSQQSANLVDVPLNSDGDTVISFEEKKNRAGRLYVLTYSAECAVNAPAGDTTAWLDVDIVANGSTVPPTAGTGDSFCGANGTAGFDGWARTSITVVFPTVAGTNTITIKARGNNGAQGLWLGDSALVIHE